MPTPLNASLTINEARLTSPSDDARLIPIGLPTTSVATLRVAFDDGTERDLSEDPRATFSTPFGTCASVQVTASISTLQIQTSTTCTTVLMEAVVTLGEHVFYVNDTRPVVYLSLVALSFSGYPDVGDNSMVSVTRLGLVPCSSIYFRAKPTVVAYITNHPTWSLGTIANWQPCSGDSGGCISPDAFCRVGDARCLTDSQCAWANTRDAMTRDCSRYIIGRDHMHVL